MTHLLHVAVRTDGAVADFAVLDTRTDNWFHGHIGATPEDIWIDYSWAPREHVIERTRPGGDPARAIFEMLNQWLNTITGRDPSHQPPLPVFVPVNPADPRGDLDWFADAFRRAGLPERFVRDATERKPGSVSDGDALTYVLSHKPAAN